MRFLGLLLPLALGAAAGLGLPPWDWWPLTLVGFAVWLHLIHEAPTLRSALAKGWLFGLGHLTVANLWIQQPFEFQDKMPPALGYIAVVLLAGYLAIYPMLAAGLAWRLAAPRNDPARRPDAAFVLVAGAAWIVTEYLRGTMFTGYPWDPLAVVWISQLGVAQLARYVGTYALSGLTVVAAGALLLLAQRRWRSALAIALPFVVAGLLPYGIIPGMDRAQRSIVVVQPNLAEEVRPTDDYAEANYQALARLSGKPTADHARLILWPEGAIRFPLEDGYPLYVYQAYGDAKVSRGRMANLLGDRDAILTGMQATFFDKDGNQTGGTNAIGLIGADAKIHARYDKAHLVPYGEYLPARPLLEAIGLSRLVPGDFDFVPGPGPRTIEVPGFGKVGMLICYEVIFSGVTVDPANRPDFIFNPSNDAWFGTLGPPAHLAQAQLRAIEEGVSIIRATPTGISAVISPNGEISRSIPMGKAGAIEAPVPLRVDPTLFARLGNWLAGIVSALLLILAIAIRRRAR